MHRPLGRLLMVLGSVLAVGALVVAVVFGPDNQVSSGPHPFSSAGAAVVTAPDALSWSGPTLEVSAEADGRPVFVGLARDLDVRDYLAGTSYTRIDTIDVPWHTTTSAVSGTRQPAARPADLDVWLVQSSGDDKASIRFPLPDAAVDVVVMDGDLRPGLDAVITMSVGHDGIFWSALGCLVLGTGLGVAGWLLLRSAPPRGGRRRAAHGRRLGWWRRGSRTAGAHR